MKGKSLSPGRKVDNNDRPNGATNGVESNKDCNDSIPLKKSSESTIRRKSSERTRKTDESLVLRRNGESNQREQSKSERETLVERWRLILISYNFEL